jgi:hypothetical protein
MILIIWLIWLLQIAVVIPLAVRRRSLTSIIAVSFGLEVAKYLFLLTIGKSLLARDDSLSYVPVFFAFTAMLPELIIGRMAVMTLTRSGLLAFLAGVFWNLGAAFLINFCLFDSNQTARKEA